MSRKSELRDTALEAGLILREYSPGDGVTRYRFFSHDEITRLGTRPSQQTYFGPASGIYTALGIKEAETFLAGYRHA